MIHPPHTPHAHAATRAQEVGAESRVLEWVEEQQAHASGHGERAPGEHAEPEAQHEEEESEAQPEAQEEVESVAESAPERLITAQEALGVFRSQVAQLHQLVQVRGPTGRGWGFRGSMQSGHREEHGLAGRQLVAERPRPPS